MYISELSPANTRGWLVSLNQLAITLRIVISYWVDYAFAGTGVWRWMLGRAVVPAVLSFFGVALLPETPAGWYAMAKSWRFAAYYCGSGWHAASVRPVN